MNNLSVINGIAVGVFGMLLSAAFCDILWTKQKRLLMVVGMAMLLLLQGIVCFAMNFDAVRHFYPVIMHMPLAMMLCVFSKRRLWSMIAVFVAYLCCQLRRWVALLIVAALSGDSMMQNVVELAVTVPLLMVLLKFAAPSVRSLSHDSVWIQCQFGLIPILSYGFDYLTRIYTDLFSKGAPVVAEFMSFVCSAAYLVFVLCTSREKQIRNQLEQSGENLNLQIAQAVREIGLLRESQQQTSMYRHDLRHHLQYISTCIENNRLEQAQEYIYGICTEMEASKVRIFCENESANLILSAFVGRAEEQDIPIEVRAEIPQIIPVSENDLCVLLSNALENALHACQKRKEKGIGGTIEVSAYEKNGKLFLQIVNSCDTDIIFDKGIPVTDRPGHGVGVRSICTLVERHGGIYTFSVKDDKFILRISI